MDEIWIRAGDELKFEVVAKVREGRSARYALREYGFRANEISRVIADLDAFRSVKIRIFEIQRHYAA